MTEKHKRAMAAGRKRAAAARKVVAAKKRPTKRIVKRKPKPKFVSQPIALGFQVTKEMVEDDFATSKRPITKTVPLTTADKANDLLLAALHAADAWKDAVRVLDGMDERHEDYIGKLAHLGFKFQNYLSAVKAFRGHVVINADAESGE